MAEDKFADSGAFGDAPDLADIGVQHRHPVEGGTGGAVPLEIAEIGHLMDEDHARRCGYRASRRVHTARIVRICDGVTAACNRQADASRHSRPGSLGLPTPNAGN
jgi:hypothetical protein